MIETVFNVPMGRRFASVGKGLKPATAAICVIQHGDMSITHGVGVLYPDVEHLYFTEMKTRNPMKLWRGVHAVSKISCLSDSMLESVVAITDDSIPIDDPRFAKMDDCLMYGYDQKKLRSEILALEPQPNDIQKIVLGFKFMSAPIDDPFAKITEKKSTASCGIFQKMSCAEMNVMSLAT